MRPAREGNIPVRVKNSYNPQAAGTLIKRTRDLSEVCIVFMLKREGVGGHRACRILSSYFSRMLPIQP